MGGMNYWKDFDEKVAPRNLPGDDAFAAEFCGQVKATGCAVFGQAPGIDWDKARAEWIKVCRGDDKLEKMFSKVVGVVEIAAQPLLDALEVERRRADAAVGEVERMRDKAFVP